jgi:NDP-sugar pyrophosphorylase family protein
MLKKEKINAIILAGGFGTRLKEMVPNLPKPLAPILGTPFLNIILKQLDSFNLISEVILAIGYQSEKIKEYYKDRQFSFPIRFSEEEFPLGTGGGLKKALKVAQSDDVLVLNGDTFFPFSLSQFFLFHKQKGGLGTLICVPKHREGNCGHIQINAFSKILTFCEKDSKATLINAGIYLFKKNSLDSFPSNNFFSLETEGFPSLIKEGLYGYVQQSQFIDIGTKESYKEAQTALKSFL